MCKRNHHKSKHFRRFLLLVLFVMPGVLCFSQVDTAEPIYDEEVMIEALVPDSTTLFDAVNSYDKSLVHKRNVNEAQVKKIKEDKAFWYVNEAPKRDKPKIEKKRSNSFFSQKWFGNLMWFIITGGFIAIIIWFLVTSNVKLFQKKSSKIPVNSNELVVEDIFEINYDNEIAKAIKENDFRLGVRLLYLQLLKDLSQKNIIQYKQDRTNGEYLLQLFGTSYYADFFQLTRSFEYTWYGQFLISEESFYKVQSNFSQFKSKFS